MRRVLVFSLCALAASLAAPHAARADDNKLIPYVWNDTTGARDMPWLGKGGRAGWYRIDKTKPWDFMNPRGPTIETHWGASGASGEDPSETAERAMAYLARVGFVKDWPRYPGYEGHEGPLAMPWRMTIVAIQPTVAILRFDLSAALADPIPFAFGAFPPSHRNQAEIQDVTGSGTVNRVMIGTHLVDRPGTLLWFAPELGIAPRPLDVSSGRAEMVLPAFRLQVVRRSGELEVGWSR
jgi:hypothetical protein